MWAMGGCSVSYFVQGVIGMVEVKMTLYLINKLIG